MDIVFFVLLIANIYVIVYFRLMARHYENQAAGEAAFVPASPTRRFLGGFGDLFTPPAYRNLPPEGRRYALWFWGALAASFLWFIGLIVTF